ncbi:MAG: Eco57I restriction-modification methylase domain-containing protein [Elusimicrobiota bacterium]|nr:Eco57I restriction-modification methylase domain-containing protein [Elusimicrobiota bacterium]
MRGFVPTPEAIVDRMVYRLFRGRAIDGGVTVLDPGCGEGLFIDGVIRWCKKHRRPIPRIVGVELHPGRSTAAKERFKSYRSVEIRHTDFLVDSFEKFDYIIGNPPYVSIGHLDEAEKRSYRSRYEAAKGRFDLYMLFFEQGMRQLQDGGRLVFITPEKYLYVDTARALRVLLSQKRLAELSFVREDAFEGYVTYPLITVIENKARAEKTHVALRDGSTKEIELKGCGSSWLAGLSGGDNKDGAVSLQALCSRISCGVATGADSVFVRQSEGVESALAPFAYPTIAGRQLRVDADEYKSVDVMLIPYGKDGKLLSEASLGALKDYLKAPKIKERLLARTCSERKPWYSFHDNMPFSDILRPKILCKDITSRPRFWVDRQGTIVPRHSVYYIVPKNPADLDGLTTYLNSKPAAIWLAQNCQRAANGFLRLQSSVLKRMPIPAKLTEVER